jgi:hypothetical protein
MFVVSFAILMVSALLIVFTEVIMRVRLSRGGSSPDRLRWWRVGSDEVEGVYEAAFSGTLLSRTRRYLFWLVIVCCLTLFASFLYKGI